MPIELELHTATERDQNNGGSTGMTDNGAPRPSTLDGEIGSDN